MCNIPHAFPPLKVRRTLRAGRPCPQPLPMPIPVYPDGHQTFPFFDNGLAVPDSGVATAPVLYLETGVAVRATLSREAFVPRRSQKYQTNPILTPTHKNQMVYPVPERTRRRNPGRRNAPKPPISRPTSTRGNPAHGWRNAPKPPISRPTSTRGNPAPGSRDAPKPPISRLNLNPRQPGARLAQRPEAADLPAQPQPAATRRTAGTQPAGWFAPQRTFV